VFVTGEKRRQGKLTYLKMGEKATILERTLVIREKTAKMEELKEKNEQQIVILDIRRKSKGWGGGRPGVQRTGDGWGSKSKSSRIIVREDRPTRESALATR